MKRVTTLTELDRAFVNKEDFFRIHITETNEKAYSKIEYSMLLGVSLSLLFIAFTSADETKQLFSAKSTELEFKI